MPAAIPRFYFQPLRQHEVLRVESTLNAGSLCSRHVKYGNTTELYYITGGSAPIIFQAHEILSLPLTIWSKIWRLDVLFSQQEKCGQDVI